MKGKHCGNRNPYTDQRDAELILAFRKAKKKLLDEKGYIVLREAVDIARCSPCSRYFVSEERASIILKQLLLFDEYIKSLADGNPIERPVDALENMLIQKRRMFSHLFVVYKEFKKQHPEYSHEELVLAACSSPAEEFYLTVSSATEILSRIHINASNNYGHTSNRKLTNRK